MLKEVGVQLSTLQRLVGQDVVGELPDLQFDALLLQNGRRLLEDLPVGRGAGPHLQHHPVSLLLVFFSLLGTAPQSQNTCHTQSGNANQILLFHRNFLQNSVYFMIIS